MRIAYLVNQYPKVSHSFIRREILALERQGSEVIRIALRGWAGELVDEEDLIERKRTRYVLRDGTPALIWAFMQSALTRPASFVRALALAFRMSHRAERPLIVHLIYLAEACRVKSWLQAVGARHLHTHFGTNSAEVAMLVHVLGGPPWSFTVHGPEEFDKAQFIGLGEKIRRCSFVVAVSSYGRSQLYRWVEHGHWSKVHVVHCGLDKDYLAWPVVPVPATRRLVCVGRLCEQKGQLLLIEAAQRLVAQGVEFELVLAGDGEMRGTIEAHVEHYNLQGRVRITGWISGAQVRDEILAARALVLPSFAEGLPVVIMEAMALRRPVISTFVGGIPELVQTGEHGWLVPAANAEALMHAIQACLDTPGAVLNRMGVSAHQRVLARHSVDAQTALLANLFDAAVESRMNFSNVALFERDEQSETKPGSHGGVSK
jgi:glycosyltransferase involved in cell wall biosynthesis